MNRTARTVLATTAAALALTACSSNTAPTAAPVVTTATTAPATASPTTTDPNAAATHAVCAKLDTGIANLATLTAQLESGSLASTAKAAITIGKADIAIRAAIAGGPKSDVVTDATDLAAAAEALSTKLTTPDPSGTLHVGNELAVVKVRWSALNADCGRVGYTLANTIK